MFCHNTASQCLLSADNSQPITLVGPQVVLDRFITTNTPGQLQVIHQATELIQRCQAGATLGWPTFSLLLHVKVMTPFTRSYGFFQGRRSFQELDSSLHGT